MLSGVDLAYTGKKACEFVNERNHESRSMIFRHAFKNVGALVMRIQLGQAQRAALLQSICREDYCDNPAHEKGEGGNQDDLFSIPQSASSVCQTTRSLEQIAHYTLGRGKILNERTQPQIRHNTKQLHGEEYLWDALHSPVWAIGLNLAGQLARQGFEYVCCPESLDEPSYALITRELNDGSFERTMIDDKACILTESRHCLEIARVPELEISLDPEHKMTSQKNGFVISHHGKAAPVGWMLHSGEQDQLVDPQYTEDLLRVIRIAKGKTHQLSKAEYSLLLNEMRAKTDGVRFTQNRTLNLLDDVVQELEREYGFDPVKLIGSAISTSYNLIQSRMKETDVVEDFLTGILITEMAQVLKLTESRSSRPRLPHEFTNSFDITLNSAKAFAYAYDLQKPDGSPALLLADDKPVYESDERLTDVRLNGDLQDPDLSNPRHAAALLASGILIAEQMLLEQLLRDACVFGDEHPNALALQKILNNHALYFRLKAMAKEIPGDSRGPILGLQVKSCEPLIDMLRTALGFDHLADAARQIYAEGSHSMKIKKSALFNLFHAGNVLQTLETTSAAHQGSRGLNAGIVPVIRALAPALYTHLVEEGEIKEAIKTRTAVREKTVTRPRVEEAEEEADSREEHHLSGVGVCPYLGRRVTDQPSVTQDAYHPDLSSARVRHKGNTWCQFFTKTVVPVAAVSLTIGAAAISLMNGA
ncbi:hypothetical protein AQUSIP_07400 [Aquicella siphonis]|uniref:Uncharacterized protein n=1 Tax=Aquicella siphonis TaxID=254247 RepID=A0A5E4PEP9_9COXI|nr:Dot/Icm T4SS effector Ceg17 [Aquicella siphonis]VVC75450.1 hypothetical protein AQUSIP_07400 [Aquicella siphonis]